MEASGEMEEPFRIGKNTKWKIVEPYQFINFVSIFVDSHHS